MERGGIEGDEGDPVTVEFGHVAQRLAQQRGRVQIMFFLQQSVKRGPFVVLQQPDADAFQKIGFITNGCENHALILAPGHAEVQSFFIARLPACIPGLQVNQPWKSDGRASLAGVSPFEFRPHRFV